MCKRLIVPGFQPWFNLWSISVHFVSNAHDLSLLRLACLKQNGLFLCLLQFLFYFFGVLEKYTKAKPAFFLNLIYFVSELCSMLVPFYFTFTISLVWTNYKSKKVDWQKKTSLCSPSSVLGVWILVTDQKGILCDSFRLFSGTWIPCKQRALQKITNV